MPRTRKSAHTIHTPFSAEASFRLGLGHPSPDSKASLCLFCASFGFDPKPPPAGKAAPVEPSRKRHKSEPLSRRTVIRNHSSSQVKTHHRARHCVRWPVYAALVAAIDADPARCRAEAHAFFPGPPVHMQPVPPSPLADYTAPVAGAQDLPAGAGAGAGAADSASAIAAANQSAHAEIAAALAGVAATGVPGMPGMHHHAAAVAAVNAAAAAAHAGPPSDAAPGATASGATTSGATASGAMASGASGAMASGAMASGAMASGATAAAVAPGFAEPAASAADFADFKARGVAGHVVANLVGADLADALAAFLVSYDIARVDRFAEFRDSVLRAMHVNDVSSGGLLVGEGRIPAEEFVGFVEAQLGRDDLATRGAKAQLRRFVMGLDE